MDWPDNERWELIDSEAYNMSHAPSRRHRDILREIGMQIAQFLKNKSCTIYFAPFDVRLPEEGESEKEI
ncbi:MAG: Uma2 family endonuclease [Spirochaetales bacterium]|nr:Uma2 family endonuclease [Spirochaetales bacterium]